jgi:4-carboxymuconolactone decarboxylase
VNEATVNTVAKHGDVGALPEDDALIIRFGRELHGNRQVSDNKFQAARHHFREQGVVELTATMGYYALLAYTFNTFEVQPAPDTLRLP